MPCYYTIMPGALQTTNATPNTENDSLFVTPGSAKGAWVRMLKIAGRMGGATSLSAITARVKKWTTTASSAGTSITPAPDEVGFQAAKAAAGYSATAVTSGTGGPTLLGLLSCGVTSADYWQAPQTSLDDAYGLEPAATKSIDCFVSSPTASQNYELWLGIAE
jgi:hypothetical protein